MSQAIEQAVQSKYGSVATSGLFSDHLDLLKACLDFADDCIYK